MLTIKETEKRKQIKYISIEDLVPENHLLRKVERLVDFSFIREEVKELYCEVNSLTLPPLVRTMNAALNAQIYLKRYFHIF